MALPNVPEHGHCEICHTPVKVGERFCGSAACAEKHQQNIKEKKRQVYMFIGVIVAAVLLSYLFRA